MKNYSIYKTEIVNKLSLLPKELLPEINNFLDFLKHKKDIKQNKKSLKGIWKNKGFEKVDIEKEVNEIRKNISQKE